MCRECLLEILLLILEVIVSKVLVVFGVVEKISVTRVELEGIGSCWVVLSIAIVVVGHIV